MIDNQQSSINNYSCSHAPRGNALTGRSASPDASMQPSSPRQTECPAPLTRRRSAGLRAAGGGRRGRAVDRLAAVAAAKTGRRGAASESDSRRGNASATKARPSARRRWSFTTCRCGWPRLSWRRPAWGENCRRTTCSGRSWNRSFPGWTRLQSCIARWSVAGRINSAPPASPTCSSIMPSCPAPAARARPGPRWPAVQVSGQADHGRPGALHRQAEQPRPDDHRGGAPVVGVLEGQVELGNDGRPPSTDGKQCFGCYNYF